MIRRLKRSGAGAFGMLALLALAAAVNASAADQHFTLYEQVCLKAFPDDRAVEALMKERNATEMSQEDVRVTMGADPARGWKLPEGGSVWLELPPFHACSVRWNTPQIPNLGDYWAISEAYKNTRRGFTPMKPMDADKGDIHIHAVGDRRVLADNSVESLFFIDQHITDAKRRAAGQTGFSVRAVHQFAPPEKRSRQ
jgi:hypothetical protein